MIKYLDLRKQNYLDRRKLGGHQQTLFDIDLWRKNPYSCFKARIYIEISTSISFFCTIYETYTKSYFFNFVFVELLLVSF